MHGQKNINKNKFSPQFQELFYKIFIWLHTEDVYSNVQFF